MTPAELSGAVRPEAELTNLLRWHGGRHMPIGPGFEVVVVPKLLADQAVKMISPMDADPVGAVAALADDGWAFFVPEESYGPGWPDRTRSLGYGSTIELPQTPGMPQAAHGARWVRWRGDGRFYTAPLLLQFALAAVRGGRPLTA
ncbi:hypothetical protein [Streptomyces sp. MZ04]|uniref:hypothetical protein n=1 Tax=Streptomyces sp. MZ04 TaxID=2559236 RepID=UPI00107EBF28|nr:hypothetical protein [Streptomyces sp. MZ04]TGB15537.1 hypothetical protein E2651_02660 [Streptomyces sp. MZ04]